MRVSKRDGLFLLVAVVALLFCVWGLNNKVESSLLVANFITLVLQGCVSLLENIFAPILKM